MAKLNKRLHIRRTSDQKVESANIYSTKADLDPDQPCLAVRLDNNQVGYVQGTRNLTDNLAINAYVKKTGVEQAFRLKSVSGLDIPSATVVFTANSRQTTFTLPKGISRVLAIVISSGLNNSFRGGEADLYGGIHPPQNAKVTGKSTVVLDSGNGQSFVSVDSPIRGFLLNRTTGMLEVATNVRDNFQNYYGITAALQTPNGGYRHGKQSSFRAKVFNVKTEVDNATLKIAVPTAYNDPMTGVVEVKNITVSTSRVNSPTVSGLASNGTVYTGSDIDAPIVINAIGNGGVGAKPMSPNHTQVASDYRPTLNIAIEGSGAGRAWTENLDFSRKPAPPTISGITVHDDRPLPGGIALTPNDENQSQPSINNIRLPDKAGYGEDGESIKQPYIERLAGFDEPMLSGGLGGAPGRNGSPGKVSKFAILNDDLTISYFKSGSGGAGGVITTGKVINDSYIQGKHGGNGTGYQYNKITVTNTGNTINHPAYIEAIWGGGLSHKTLKVLHPTAGAVILMYGPDIESGLIPLYVWELEYKSISTKNTVEYKLNGLEGCIPFSPKKFILEKSVELTTGDTVTNAGTAVVAERDKVTSNNCVVEYFDTESNRWKNFVGDGRTATFSTSEGKIVVDIPLRIYATKWRVRCTANATGNLQASPHILSYELYDVDSLKRRYSRNEIKIISQ